MKIERLKSILLIMLVISSIVLTANKWFSEELWPGGYSFFSDVKNKFSPGTKTKTESFNPNEEILKPAQIIINNQNNHVLFTKSSEKYDDLCKEITNILSKSIDSTQKTDVKDDEWTNQLKTRSCYFTYPVIYNSSYFASQLSKTYIGSLGYFREFIIARDQRIPTLMYVYKKDAESGKIEKTGIDFEGENILYMIENAEEYSEDINYYSFELNFDNNNNESVSGHAVIDRNVLINISGKNASLIYEKNLFDNIASNHELYAEILSRFNYNTSTIRKYVENDNSMVFVENYGTLKLHSNGMLDYKAIDTSSGIELEGNSVNALLNSCLTFVNTVTSVMDKNKSMYYEISSDIHDIQTTSFTLTFDYYINDNKIIIPPERYPRQNAITVHVENGKITSYSQLFVSFNPGVEIVNCGSAIDAIDNLNTLDNPESVRLSDIFVAYHFDEKFKLWHPLWHIEDSDGNISTIASDTEVLS